MDGVHDMGGMQGFGPVDVDAVEAFHEGWEARLQVLTLMSGADTRRHLEELEPDLYLGSSYYERWLVVAERRSVADGLVESADLDRWRERILSDPDIELPRSENPDRLPGLERAILTTPLMHPVTDPSWVVGDRVRVRRSRPAHHHRCPRYVRGVLGEVTDIPGAECPPQGPADPELAEPVYTVRFCSVDLWGDPGAGEAPFDLFIDLWQSYLEAP